jgi:transcriptional regulator with PAS, ATPase and Fis domain
MTTAERFPDLPAWVSGFPGALTVTDADGTLLYLNDKAARTFEAQGGRDLVGTDLMACHNERSRAIIRRLLETGASNTYTIEKKGVKKLIHQAPWVQDGKIAGLIEVSIEIPGELPHFVRG